MEPVTIREDVILVFRFDRLGLAVGEAGGLSAHEEVPHDTFWYSQDYRRVARNTIGSTKRPGTQKN